MPKANRNNCKKLLPFLLISFIFLLTPPTWSSEVNQKPIPAFTLTALDGQKVSIEERKGHALTALVFFATWSSKSSP
jgi:hypothetical protein